MVAYLLFAEHNITPGQYYSMSSGEKLLLRAFLLRKYGKKREVSGVE